MLMKCVEVREEQANSGNYKVGEMTIFLFRQILRVGLI